MYPPNRISKKYKWPQQIICWRKCTLNRKELGLIFFLILSINLIVSSVATPLDCYFSVDKHQPLHWKKDACARRDFPPLHSDLMRWCYQRRFGLGSGRRLIYKFRVDRQTFCVCFGRVSRNTLLPDHPNHRCAARTDMEPPLCHR